MNTKLKTWSHALHQITGEMALFTRRPIPEEKLIEWATSLLLIARSMRQVAEEETTEH